MLRIQVHLRKEGLKKTEQKFKLQVKDLGHKVMFKYDQLRSPKQHVEVHEARGLVLEKDTWNIMSYPFKRFFDQNDFYSPKLDWNKTVVMEKRDGSLIQVYWDYVTEEWCVNTMFSECEEKLFSGGKKIELTLGSLFLYLMKDYGSSFEKFNKGFTYIFELTSVHNKVVVSYAKPELRLIGYRNLKTFEEHDYYTLQKIAKDISIPVVEIYPFKSIKECLQSLKNKSFNFEGYVAWDGNARIKIKNSGYVAVHLTKTTEENILDLSEPHLLLDVVKNNELDEFLTSFPHAAELVKGLHFKYNNLLTTLEKAQTYIKPPKNITKAENTLYASSVFNTLNDLKLSSEFGNVFFALKDGKVETIEDYISNYDNKKLYKLLNKS